ncbi:MAG: ABC transporter ATP-binding protein [Actinobacteria bacterium]|nr:ABC transporter ATP-binding protein [Actinomycetota bacterium]
MNLTEVKNLSKKYNEHLAVDNISFYVKEGEIFGLLGPNGAGKSTTISMLSCLLEPTSGEAFIDGKSIKKDPMGVKKVIGLIPQEIALYPTLSAKENLYFWGKMYGLSGSLIKKRVKEILEIVGLTDRAKDRIDTYSGGMKRRINIAAGLIHRPKVIMLDEPTVGIDPQTRINILETVKNLNKLGMTIIYTSHYMEEVEMLCNRIAIMDEGRIIAMGTKNELRLLVGGKDTIRMDVKNIHPKIAESLEMIDDVDKIKIKENQIEILSDYGRRVLSSVISKLNELDVKINSVKVQEPDLESVFIHLTGKSLRE